MMQTLLREYKDFSENSLSFIPSENIVSQSIIDQIPADLYNRYYFDAMWENEVFPASYHIRKIKNYVISQLNKQFKSDYVNIDTISGLNLMTTVFLSLLSPGESVYVLPSNKGGHHVTKEILLQLWYQAFYIPFDEDGYMDQVKMWEEIKLQNIGLVYIDQMMWNMEYDFRDLQKNIPESCQVYYDVSHNMAYLFQTDTPSPLLYWFDAFGGSTHKTFPGGHKGIFCTNNKKIDAKFSQTAKEFVSHTHSYDLAILGLVIDKMEDSWDIYIRNITQIQKQLTSLFQKLGFEIITLSDTPNHQILVSHPHRDIKILHKKYSEAGILFNFLNFGNKQVLRIWVQEFAYSQPNQEQIMIVMKYILQVFSNIPVDQKIILSLNNSLKK